jgi:hypothetical protein
MKEAKAIQFYQRKLIVRDGSLMADINSESPIAPADRVWVSEFIAIIGPQFFNDHQRLCSISFE